MHSCAPYRQVRRPLDTVLNREQEQELWPQEIDGIPFPQLPRPSQLFLTRQGAFLIRDTVILVDDKTLIIHILDHFAARLDAEQVWDQAACQEAKVSNIVKYFQAEC